MNKKGERRVSARVHTHLARHSRIVADLAQRGGDTDVNRRVEAARVGRRRDDAPRLRVAHAAGTDRVAARLQRGA